MTYEEYLDEVTTLLTELYELSDAAAIKLVVQAQAKDYFVAHDDHESMRTQERAEQDAKTLYSDSKKKPARPTGPTAYLGPASKRRPKKT